MDRPPWSQQDQKRVELGFDPAAAGSFPAVGWGLIHLLSGSLSLSGGL